MSLASPDSLRQGDDGVKNIRFFGEICCSRSIFARVFTVQSINCSLVLNK